MRNSYRCDLLHMSIAEMKNLYSANSNYLSEAFLVYVWMYITDFMSYDVCMCTSVRQVCIPPCALNCKFIHLYIGTHNHPYGDHFLTLIIDKCDSYDIRLNDSEREDQ